MGELASALAGILERFCRIAPYIEYLGTMYLLKLRHGEKFSSIGGAVWLVIFVIALCTWLRKFRYPQYLESSEEDDVLTESGEHFLSAMLEIDSLQLVAGLGAKDSLADHS
jgi:membrane protein YdbS with pleckstrin-like domain